MVSHREIDVGGFRWVVYAIIAIPVIDVLSRQTQLGGWLLTDAAMVVLGAVFVACATGAQRISAVTIETAPLF